MPSDELFNGGPGPDPAPAPDPAPVPTDPTPPAAPSLSAADVEQQIARATAPLAERTTALQRENDALRLAIQQATQGPVNPATPEDFVAQFNKNPEAAVKAIAEQASSEGMRQLAPHFNTLIQSANTAFLGGEQQRIEQEFGTKAWQEVYQPALADRFAQIRKENPFAVADLSRVRMEVDTITGANFQRVSALRDEHLKGRTTAETAATQRIVEEARKGITTNLTGGIRNTPKGTVPELDPDMKDAIANMDRATGERTDHAEFARRWHAAQNAKSLDDWLELTKQPGQRTH